MKEAEISAGGYLPASFLDWDGQLSAVIFTAGCNFRCPWCHNGALVSSGAELLDIEKILAEIKRRAKFLDGVVVSGGEPTLQPGLCGLILRLRALVPAVKLDTNGSSPEILKKLLSEKLVDFVAMDLKAPLNNESYSKLCGCAVETDKIKESVALIKELAPAYEFRTTVVPGLTTEEELRLLRAELSDDSHWVLQPFRPEGCLDPEYLTKKAVDSEKLRKIFPEIKIRG